MNRFIQLHLLTFVPPANLNRDDIGRPKTAVVGGATRLRLSSQSLKRAWRTSNAFADALEGHLGVRTKKLGDLVLAHLLRDKMPEKQAIEISRQIAGVFGAIKKDGVEIEQLAFISPEEQAAALEMANKALAGEKLDLKPATLLQRADTAADIALFGRMLAATPDYSRDAAVQVAHAITTHAVVVEDDYFTALDDLAQRSDSSGAGASHVGESQFGSGIFYSYLCVNRDLLIRNLAGDVELADTALGALVRAAATTLPSGKQNSFAALSRASYVLAERGDGQPRTLAGAFQRPVTGPDLLAGSVAALRTHYKRLAMAYGDDLSQCMELDVEADDMATLAEVIAFCRGEG